MNLYSNNFKEINSISKKLYFKKTVDLIFQKMIQQKKNL